MFVLSKEWLFKYYGSNKPGQIEDTRRWLLTYGTNVPKESLDEWSNWMHLSQYQVNTNLIVPICLGHVGFTFVSELSVHAWVNSLRVPMASSAYKMALEDIVDPMTILELGVGGDSAISTSIWLSHLEFKEKPLLISIDINPLGMTWERYKDVPFWKFNQIDSVTALEVMKYNGYLFDMIFIDTIHSYEHTLKELNLSKSMTNFILMDDATFEGNDFDKEPGGVKKAIKDWRKENSNWDSVSYADGTVELLIKSWR